MPVINADIAGAMKGKRTVDTLRDAADTELARAKIEATGIADRIKANLATLTEHQHLSALFPDVQALVLKQPDDLAAMITSRISVHEANEAARKAREAEQQAELIAQQAREAAAKPVQVLAADPRDALAQVMATGPALVQQPATLDEMHAIGEGVSNWPEPTDTGAMIKLGEINARLAPIAITADGLKSLGFEHVAVDRAAKLYKESDFPKICDALIKTITLAKHPQLATA
jgi:hypothetical protein